MQRLTFELVQHTPIIHFQANDRGATLRASEVKPKLDKYLMQKFEKEGFYRSQIEKWSIPGQEALNYKLSFRLKEGASMEYYLPVSNMSKKNIEELQKRKELKDIKILSPSPFFANEEKLKKGQEKWAELKLAILSKENIVGEIFSKYEDLCDFIKLHLEDFFLLHNFGMRQTKGFGSYTISSIPGMRIAKSQRDIAQRMKDIGVVDCLESKSNDVRYQFGQIAKFHNKIKTGARGTISELRYYFHEKKIEWEKILELEMLNRLQESNSRIFPVRYIRALLGLHEHFEFPNGRNNKKVIRVSHDNIDRFASPITYKPIGGIIYIILAEEIPSEMLGAEFIFSTDSVYEQSILTPDTFDLADFLSFIQDDNLVDVKELL
ncbi:MAG: hypothetical protein Q3998_06310 [Porphyromonas sp.]|nr:hypothetical protein [Porphyromonas sp.]